PSEDVRRRPTLPHPPECSTIGAIELSFRVRNGTGRFLDAMTAVTRREPTSPQHTDRKSTHLNSSHVSISYAVFCLKKKHNRHQHIMINSRFYMETTSIRESILKYL